MSENTTTIEVEATETTTEERTLFGISYKKIGIVAGASVAVTALAAAGYFAYKAFAPKAVQAIVDPVIEPAADAVADVALKRMF